MDILNRISEIGVVPVIKLDNPKAHAQLLAKALSKGGLPIAEVTFRVDDADLTIKLMKEAEPEMIVGAGTVLTTNQVDKAILAGAEFIVSPGLNPKIVEYCQSKNILILPGCVTPTEIAMALELGLTNLKFFPAAQYGGIKTINALCAPYNMIKFMPTGGITLENLEEYLSNKNVIACGGSYMVNDTLIKNNDFDKITELSKLTRAIVDKVKATK